MSGTFLINKKIFDPNVTMDSKGRVTDMSFNSTINALHCPDMDTQNMVIKNTLDVSKVDVSNCFILPVGNNDSRVTTTGSIRYNNVSQQFEGCDNNNQWGPFGGGAWSEVNPGEIRLTTDLNYNKVADIKDVTISGTGLAPTAVSTDNSTKIATTAFVQTAVAGIVDSAPETLNTLNELAAALGDDPNYTTTITTKLGIIDASFVVVDASFVSVTNDINTINNNKQNNLTFGLSAGNAVKIHLDGASTGNYARFGTDGIKGRTVAEVKTDLALNLVDNTSDADKPISTAQQNALNQKHPLIDASNRLNANLIADGSVDNTEFQYLDGTTGNIQLQINELDASANLQEKHINAYTSKTINVTVKPKTPSHPNIGQGSAECYYFDNVETPIIMLIPGITYIFDQSEPTNANHPLRFYEDEQKGLIYNEGVTSTGLGTEGNPGAYTQIIVTKKTKMRLFYQCFHHPLMGGKALVYNSENCEYFYSKDASFNDVYINNDLHVKNDISCNNIFVDGHSFKDLSGTVTNLINQPVGIWSEVNTDEIRLTTSSDYGKLVDISGLKITNNVEVLGDISCNDVSCNGVLNVDTINEKTNLNGVVIEGVTVKNNSLTAGSNGTITASNFNVGTRNIVSASAQGSFTDLEIKDSNGHVGLLAYGDTGNVNMTGTLEVDTINEKTNLNGVVIEGVTVKNNSLTAGSNGTITASNFNVGTRNIVSASAQGSFTDLEIKDSNGHIGLLVDGANGNVEIYGTLEVDTINEITSATGVTIENVLFRDGDISCNGLLHVSGDISCNNINIGSNSFTDLSNNITQLDVSANKYENRLNTIDISFTVVDASFASVETKMEMIDNSFSIVDASFTKIDGLMNIIDASFSVVDASFSSIDTKMQTIDTSFSVIDVSYVDLSGTVTNLINQPVGIWSEVTTDEIRLTTASNYGKLVDISGMDISNNLSVEGGLTLGFKESSSYIQGTLRYTDVSRVEVYYNSKWNQLSGGGGGGGGGGLWGEVNSGEIRLSSESNYNKTVDISGMDISNNLTVKGKFNLSGDLYKNGTLVSLNSEIIQVIENIVGLSDGQSILGNQGTYTLPDVTKQTPASGNYFSDWTDVSGSKIEYKPPPGAKYIKYVYKFAYGKTLYDEQMMTNIRFLIGNTVITSTMKQLTKEKQNNYYTFETIIRIDSTLSSDDLQNLAVKDWTANRTLKIQIKEFNQVVGSQSWLHNIHSWENGAPVNKVSKPTMDVMVVGNLIQKIDVSEITKLISISGETIQMVENIAGLAEGQTLDGFQSNYTLENVTAKQTPSSGTYFSTWHDILGSKLSYKPPENSPIVKYSFKFAYGKKLFDDNLMTNIRFLLGGTVVTNTEIQLNKDNQNNQYTFDCIIRIDDTLSSDDVANSKLKTWTANKEMKLQIKEFNNDVGNESWLHNFYSWENGAPVNKVIKPTLDIQAMGYLTRIITDISSGIWGEVNSNEIRMTNATNYDKKLDVSGIDVSNNLVVDGIFSLNGRFNTHLLPTTNAAYDLGNAEYKIRHLFLSDNSLWIGDDHKIDVSGGKMKFKKRNKNKVPQSLLNTGKDESTILNEIFGPGHGKTTQNVALHQWYEYAARPGINISNDLLFSSTGLGDGVDDFLADIESSDSLLIQDVDQTILGTKTFTNIIISGTTTFNGDLKTNNAIKDNNGTTRIGLGTTNTITGTLNITDNLNISGTIGSMFDNRIYEVDEISPGRWEVGFGCWDNNNSGPYADMIVLKTYGDSTGGNPNLIAFKKSGIGMRIYQDSYSSTSAFSTYKDVLLAGNHASVSSLNCDGNVGIGTTTPGAKLDVVGDISCSRIISNIESVATSFYASGLQIPNTSSNYNMILSGNPPSNNGNGAVHFINSANRTDDGGTLTYTIRNDNGRLRLGNASYDTLIEGNVGIGTASPDEKLEIIGNLKLRTPESTSSSGDAANIYLDCNNGATEPKNGIIWKTDYNNGGNNYTKDSAGIYFQPEGNYFRGGLTFYTNNNENVSTVATEKMRIDQHGNVGIGRPADTSTFTYNSVEMCKFNVHADHETENNHPGNIIPAIKITRKTPSNGGPYPYNHGAFGTTTNNNGYGTHETYSASIDFYPFDYYANPVHSARIYAGNDYRGSVWQDGKIYLSTRTGNTWSSVVVSHSGYVGIGTATPNYPLQVNGYVHPYDVDDLGSRKYYNSVGAQGSFNWDTSSDSTNHRFGAKFENSIAVMGLYIVLASDQRIKENIRDVSDNDALQKLRDISCCFYEYKDKINRGQNTTIGFIAQQVKEHIPTAISLQKEIIPNEMRILADYSWNQIADASGNYDLSNNQYKLTIHDLSDNSGNTLYRFYVSNDLSGNDEIKKEIKSLEHDPKSFIFDQSWNNVFLYGKEVDDFHTLDKNKLFTLNFSATQEIDRIQQLEQTKLVAAETEITTLKSTVETQQTTINNQQTTINTLQTTLTALEARIAALENPQ